MKKKLFVAMVCGLLMCMFSVTALAGTINLETAKKKAVKVIPPTAEYLYAENESDEYELQYKDSEKEVVYRVAVSKYSNKVTEVKTRYINELGSEEVVLTVEDVKQLVADLYPDAAIKSVKLKMSKGLKKYEAEFNLGNKTENHGEIEFNPETGAIIETEIKYLEK